MGDVPVLVDGARYRVVFEGVGDSAGNFTVIPNTDGFFLIADDLSFATSFERLPDVEPDWVRGDLAEDRDGHPFVCTGEYGGRPLASTGERDDRRTRWWYDVDEVRWTRDDHVRRPLTVVRHAGEWVSR